MEEAEQEIKAGCPPRRGEGTGGAEQTLPSLLQQPSIFFPPFNFYEVVNIW